MSLILRLLAYTLDPRGLWVPGPLSNHLRRILVLSVFLPSFLVLQLVHWMGFVLDDILFRGYRRISVDEPLFVVGMPRSGTTFLHRTLAADEDRFTTLRLWELIFAPSITERRVWMVIVAVDRTLGRPVGRVWGWVQRLFLGGLDDIHETRMNDPEEDYFFLLPAFACFLLVVPFPRHPRIWRLTRFDELPREERLRIVRFYRACLQRHLYVVGEDRQILSKNPSFTSMIDTLREVFPDARIACCLRDPAEAVPSLLSSLEGGARTFGWRVTDPSMQERFVQMLVDYTEHAVEAIDEGQGTRAKFVLLPELHRDAGAAVRELYERFSWEVDPDYSGLLDGVTERSRSYRSPHKYDARRFGLQPDELERRFDAIYSRFELGSHDRGSARETDRIGHA